MYEYEPEPFVFYENDKYVLSINSALKLLLECRWAEM